MKLDLVNLFPVKLDLSPFIDAWGSAATFRLSAPDGTLNFCGVDVAPEEAGTIQTNDIYTTTGDPLYAAGFVEMPQGEAQIAPADYLGNDNEPGVLAFEAVEAYGKPKLSVLLGETSVLEFELPISLSSVRDMYRWRNLRAVCGGSALVGDRRWEPFDLPEGGTIGNPAARASHGNVNEDDFDDCFRHWEHGSLGGRERCYAPISISESPELPEAKANKRNHDEVIDRDVFFVSVGGEAGPWASVCEALHAQCDRRIMVKSLNLKDMKTEKTKRLKTVHDKSRCRRVAIGISAFLSAVAAAIEPFPEVGAPRRLTAGPHEHLLASYFGINSWSPDLRYLTALETDLNGRLPEVADAATIGLIDTADGNRFIPLAKTVCWNFQEAAMAHWLDDDTFLYNDLRDGKFVTVIRNWRNGAERIMPHPVSAVSPDGSKAISINYARIRLLRADYGYPGEGQDAREESPWPEDDGLWLVDLKTGEAKLIVSVASCRDRMPPIRRPGGLAYFCHTVFSRDGSKVFWLARTVDFYDKAKQIGDKGRQTTSFTCNVDGSDVRRCFPDGWGGSHFGWKDGATLCVTAKRNGNPKADAHVEFTVGNENQRHFLGGGLLDWDGHCTYSPDGRWMSSDGYWDANFERKWALLRLEDGAILPVGKFYVPEAYRGGHGYWRCDLHARWRPDGRQLAFNSVHEGSRQVYTIDLERK